MPYTPPAQQSPSASKPGTPPHHSRSNNQHSHHRIHYPAAPSPGPRPGLPRSHSSTTYIHRQRRSPSVTKPGQQSPPTITEIRDDRTDSKVSIDPYSSLRQSPPPQTSNIIPAGMVISPPESTSNSSDEDEGAKRGRVRQLKNLHELEAAVRIIEQNRSGSPTRQQPTTSIKPEVSVDATLASSLRSLDLQKGRVKALSQEARKISHSRSSTIDVASAISDSSIQLSDDSDGDEPMPKPPMVRKKSGELVRPALRPSSTRRRPSSMPGTPTYSKVVHFDSHLEHVRHFLKVDKPAAVSAGSSPVESSVTDPGFPFEKKFEWEIGLPNFPKDTPERRQRPVRVERVYLSNDNKHLIGVIAVANLAFHKQVTARFTLDYWKTTSEVAAVYTNDVRKKQTTDGYDRFNFDVQLEDMANLDKKALFFCVRYNTAGQEFWDSNDGTNFQVDFSKKVKPSAAASLSPLGSRPLSALPRSRPSPTSPDHRSLPMPTSFDDFTTFDNFSGFARSEGLRRRQRQNSLSKDSDDESIDVPPPRRNTASSKSFGSRYDFGRSLSAALSAANTAMGDKSGIQMKNKSKSKEAAAEVPSVTAAASAEDGTVPKPSDLVSDKPSHKSQSYQELVNKFCFFGSSKGSPQPQLNSFSPFGFDGADSGHQSSPASSSPASSREMSPEMKEQAQHIEVVPTFTPQTGRSSSPAMGTRDAVPANFGFPYHQKMQVGFLEPQGLQVIK